MIETIFETFWFWIEIASIGLAIVSYILIIIQSFNNYMFKNYKTRSLVTERLLYEQFSYEVYESLFSYTYIQGSTTTSNIENYENDHSYMDVELKLDSYYDCRDIYDPELNEEICQNQIVKNNTCCKSECCSKTNGDEAFCQDYLFNFNIDSIKNNRILYYNDEEYFDDPKRRFCSYYSTYNRINYIGIDYSLDGYLFKCKNNYIQIMLNGESSMCIGKNFCNKNPNINIDCGIIDTKGNHLFVEDSSNCPINNLYISETMIYARSFMNYNGKNRNKIIVRNILSEVEPDTHEWKNHFVSLENHKDKTSEEYNNLEKKILNTKKNDFKKLIDSDSNIYTETLFSYNEGDFSALNSKAKPRLFSTNYIGFESEKDLTNFFNYFHYPEITNNPLYKIGKEVYPSLETIICAFVLCVLCIIYLIFFWCKLIENCLWLLIVKECILGATFFILLGIYIWQLIYFEKIKIDMDSNFQKILDLYNNRRMQYCLLSGLILLFISIIPFLIFLIIQKCKNRTNQQPENPENQERQQQQNNENENFPSQYQTLDGQQTTTQTRPIHTHLGNSENQQFNINNNITESVGEVNRVSIHNERNQEN